jgi:hypothetical protein
VVRDVGASLEGKYQTVKSILKWYGELGRIEKSKKGLPLSRSQTGSERPHRRKAELRGPHLAKKTVAWPMVTHPSDLESVFYGSIVNDASIVCC